MNGLEQTFYIMGIVFMSLMFLLLIGLVAAVFVIRAKINKIHDMIESKVDTIASLAEKGGELSAIAGKTVLGQAKKAFRKAKNRK